MLGKTTLGPRVAPVVSSSSISVEDKDNFTVEAAEAIVVTSEESISRISGNAIGIITELLRIP